jgi:hypothetical protein
MVYSRGMTEQERETRRQASVLKREGTGWDIGSAARFLLSEQEQTGAVGPWGSSASSTFARLLGRER